MLNIQIIFPKSMRPQSNERKWKIDMNLKFMEVETQMVKVFIQTFNLSNDLLMQKHHGGVFTPSSLVYWKMYIVYNQPFFLLRRYYRGPPPDMPKEAGKIFSEKYSFACEKKNWKQTRCLSTEKQIVVYSANVFQ